MSIHEIKQMVIDGEKIVPYRCPHVPAVVHVAVEDKVLYILRLAPIERGMEKMNPSISNMIPKYKEAPISPDLLIYRV